MRHHIYVLLYSHDIIRQYHMCFFVSLLLEEENSSCKIQNSSQFSNLIPELPRTDTDQIANQLVGSPFNRRDAFSLL